MELEKKRQEAKQMKRVQRIIQHPIYRKCLEQNRKAEEGRVFCRHDMAHFLDVARIAYVFSLERGYHLPKDEIYAAAILHDIGRWQQYLDKTPHDQASADLAQTILGDSGFLEEECERIRKAILCHRGAGRDVLRTEPEKRGRRQTEEPVKNQQKERTRQLSEILYDADKASRPCYACAAECRCDWAPEKKNLQILW